MDSSILGPISALLIALIGALGAASLLGKKEDISEIEPYSEKLKKLTGTLKKSSKEVDSLIAELLEVAEERKEKVKKIENDLTSLQNRERELKERIENLEKVPLPVAEYFAELTRQGEKKGARRDYFLFGAGAIVSTVIAIFLKLVFGI